MNSQNQDIIGLEKKLLEREEKLDSERQRIEREKEELSKKKEEYSEKLQKVSGLTAEEAKTELIRETEAKETQIIARIIKEKEEDAKRTAAKKSQEILLDSMKHGALDFIAEYTVSTVKIEDEEIKGRIIGKEGRNIRAFEQATGVDVDLDEEGIIRLSCFDSVRREIAKRALEKLLKDTRIQPFRIEEIVNQTKQEVEKVMLEEGEKIAHTAGVFNLPVELMAILGRFKFRTSYGQNLIVHTLEETKIGMHIASEIGADVNIVRLGCLFHDIGKIGVPDQVLLKPTRLSEEEFQEMKLHPTKSYNILQEFPVFHRMAVNAKYHHERFDGRGYPEGLKGDQIPLFSRIILVADTFDAMTSTRPYRAGLALEVAFNELREFAGTQFDASVVENFIISMQREQAKNEETFSLQIIEGDFKKNAA